MDTITYLNLKVEGAPINKILQLSIKHSLNEHGTALIAGEVDYNTASDYLDRIDETTCVTISTTAQGQPSVLFFGVVSDAGVSYQSEYAILTMELKSTSSKLDMKKNNKSFQNTASTYEDILNQVFKQDANVIMEVSDKPIGSLIVQYNETNWEFAKRMASVFSAPLIANLNTKIPNLTIGIPNSGKNYKLEDTEYSYGTNGLENQIMQLSGALSETAASGDFSGISIRSAQYMFIGDVVNYGGKIEKVKGIFSQLDKGILVTTLYTGKDKGFSRPIIKNQQSSGKMFTGMVKAIKKDKVQVFLTDIDSEYDSSGDFWFPYSTAYSSSDGSGFYCMPEEGDTVRVFFPSSNEGEAFAASSVNVSPLDNPKHKKWRTPGGKEILLTEEGMYITCKENKIFINLVDETGITIYSEKDINICSKSNLSITSNNNLTIQAENNVLINTDNSYIDVKKDKIEIGADNLKIN